MTLFFQGSNGKMREVAKISDNPSVKEARKEAMGHIKKFCDERNFHIYYVRNWNTKVGETPMTCFDVGSHTEFCSILGHPFDIVPSLFVKRDKIDDTTTLISKTVKEVSVLEGNFHSEYYIELLKNLGIDVKVIPQKHPSKIFKEVR